MTFHQFLIKNRAYCERCDWGKGEANEAVTVIKDEHGHELVVCEEHAKENYDTGTTQSAAR